MNTPAFLTKEYSAKIPLNLCKKLNGGGKKKKFQHIHLSWFCKIQADFAHLLILHALHTQARY